MSDIINQNTEPLFIFDMPDDEVLSETISVKGEKGERGDPTKTSQLTNDSDFTTNAALNAGLATKADVTTVQGLASQVSANTSAVSGLVSRHISAARINASAATRWYKVCDLPADDNHNKSFSARFHGRIGGTTSGRTCLVDIIMAVHNQGLVAYGDFYYDYGDQNMDIVVYQNNDETFTAYLKVSGHCTFDLDVDVIDGTNDYNGTYSTTEPSGELIWSLSADDTGHIFKGHNGTISADITGDAVTVNGHTVESDVPSNAAFTDTIYDDTSVYAAINTKANASDVANTYATKQEVQSVASGSPLVASSVSGMTDTSRIYVNTSDGKWYYYDGSAWSIGGVYQATELSDLNDDSMASKGLTTKAMQFYKGYNLRNDYINNRYGWIQSPMQLQQNGYIAAISGTTNPNNKCVTTLIPAKSYIRIEKSNTSGRFRVGVCNTRPTNGVTATLIFEDTNATSYTFYNDAAKWLVVYYSHTTDVGDATIDVYVDSHNDVKDSIRSDALGVFETVDSDNLYLEDLRILDYGTDTAANYYNYGNYANYRSYVFPLEPNKTYNIVKSGGNRFRVCLWREQPIPADRASTNPDEYLRSHPSAVVIDDNSGTTCSFNSGNYLWCTILYSNAAEDADLTITTSDNTARRLARQYTSDLVPVAKPINPQWDKWQDVRYNYGFNTAVQPIFNTIKGVLETDTMISVRGGKGRWSHGFVDGGHVFEGWSGDETFRLTMLIGKWNKSMACIQTYSPAGLSETNRRFGWVKLGSDELRKGLDVSKGWTTVYTPLTLQSRTSAPTGVEDYDLNPQLSGYGNSVPVGTMYYDSNVNKVKVFTPDGWRSVAFE